MVSAGAEHTVAITEDGELYGWGWGRYGNLGLGDRKDRLVPEKVSSIEVCHTSENIFLLFMFYLQEIQMLSVYNGFF